MIPVELKIKRGNFAPSLIDMQIGRIEFVKPKDITDSIPQIRASPHARAESIATEIEYSGKRPGVHPRTLSPVTDTISLQAGL